MCGIVGFNWENKSLARKLVKTVTHRGPDDHGVWTDTSVSLGQTRLSIIDLSAGGHQPMTRDHLTIVYNGEIYNYQDIRKKFINKGHEFVSESDTEVILAAYEEFGDQCVTHFNGMFAFAIWDRKNKSLFIARDRLGIKPLYYYWDGSKFLFASEPKTILASGLKLRANKESITHYLNTGLTPPDKSAIKDVHKLQPGHTLKLEKKNLTIKPYWHLTFSNTVTNEEKAIEQIREHLKLSVHRRLIADVPAGSFLSGGLDSSAIVACASQMKNDLNTFSVAFEEQTLDESAYAKEISELFETTHREFHFSFKDASKFLAAYKPDEPFADPALIPTALLSQLTKKHVTVSLSGDGADESFLGYDRYKQLRTIHRLSALRFASKAASPLTRIFSTKINRALYLLKQETSYQYQELRSVVDSNIRAAVLKSATNKSFERYWTYSDYLHNAANVDVHTALVDGILTKLDKATMMSGLEGRVPFLDHTFVEYAATLSPKLKLNGNEGKYILKKSQVGVLPKHIIHRKKQGFVFPLKHYLAAEMQSDLDDQLVKKSPLHHFVRKKGVQTLIEQHKAGKRDHTNTLWTFLMLKKWMDSYPELFSQ